ncbi:MAG: hypothetical protein IKQ55_05060 [Kiritimatiellae bacterium]|nr:hypothetical protein [Kiritimatiellia bacterium]
MLPWLLALAALAACGWWMFHIPHDSRAVYRAIPARAAATLRVIDLPERWEGLVANPLVASALRTAGTEPDDALWLVRDPATRAWFDRLAGREALLAWLPAQEGQPPALLAASWLGGQAPLLRQELLLFRLPDFQRMPTAFPGRAVWRVKGLDLPRGWSLTLSFADGLLLACLSPNPWAIGELLGAHDGTFSRLLDAGIGFDALAARDDRSIPLQLWIRDDWPTPAASASVSAAPPAASPAAAPPTPLGRTIDIHRLDGERMEATGLSLDLADWTDSTPLPDLAPLGQLLGDAPCATLVLRRSLPKQALRQTWLQGDFRHGIRMTTEIAGDPLVLALLDSDFSGRLSFGIMRTLGLSGLKVPTLLAATPVPDPAAARAAAGRIMDSCNARYRGAFVFRPKTLPDGTVLCTLESAGGNEWVDELAPTDRPAWAIHGGWLLLASNRAALEKLLVAGPPSPSAAAPWIPPPSSAPPTAALWLDLQRTGTTFIHLAAMWSMAQRFLGATTDPAVQSALDNLRAWLEALRPYGQASAIWVPEPPLSRVTLALGH